MDEPGQDYDWGDDEDDEIYNIDDEQLASLISLGSSVQHGSTNDTGSITRCSYTSTSHNMCHSKPHPSTSRESTGAVTNIANNSKNSPYSWSTTSRLTSFSGASPNNNTYNNNIISIGCRVENGNEESLPGFDADAGNTWIYPINYPVREYQYNIAKQAIFKNTLVALPTGLGKTFIAAVVMYNLYRWYPTGKVIFLAPTRTLVAQQIEACFKVMGIPQDDMIEMTGSVTPEIRRRAWLSKRLFFLTPQVVVNDLSRGVCPGSNIRCVVVDEAHRATGGHSYCQVMHCLQQYTRHTRILALSATPGVDLQSVKQVISNLLISHVELRCDDSPDIAPYTHERVIDKVVVPLGESLTALRDAYLRVVRVYVLRLINMGVIYTRDESTLTKFQVLKAREQCRAAPPAGLTGAQQRSAEGGFALCLTLYHALDLLLQHGARSFYNFLVATLEGDKGQSIARSELMRNRDFMALMGPLRTQYSVMGPRGNVEGRTAPVASHPKMEKLVEVVREHFERCAAEARTTRVIIFSQYRDSVSEITELLGTLAPLVKPMSFLGQSTSAKGSKGVTQKEQIMVVKKFRSGDYNTLVSTCVGEEGLDIGEVDLIVCYDAPKSPIRLVQRMGRTGRKRQGRIVVLLTKGKEEQTYNMSQFQKRSIHSVLRNTDQLQRHLYAHAPRMVPAGMEPVCQKLSMQVESYQVKVKLQRRPKPVKTNNRLRSLFCTNKARNQLLCGSSGSVLTTAERAWYDEHLRTPPEEVVHLSAPRMLALEDKASWSCLPSQRTICLGAYQPWQSSLQRHHQLPPGPRVRQLVALTTLLDARVVDEVATPPLPGAECMTPFLDYAEEGENKISQRNSPEKRKKSLVSRKKSIRVSEAPHCRRPKVRTPTKQYPKGKTVASTRSILNYFTSQAKSPSSDKTDRSSYNIKRPSTDKTKRLLKRTRTELWDANTGEEESLLKRARKLLSDGNSVEEESDELQIVFDSQRSRPDSIRTTTETEPLKHSKQCLTASAPPHRASSPLRRKSSSMQQHDTDDHVQVVPNDGSCVAFDAGETVKPLWSTITNGFKCGFEGRESPLHIRTPPDIDVGGSDGDNADVILSLEKLWEEREREKQELISEFAAYIEVNNNTDILEDVIGFQEVKDYLGHAQVVHCMEITEKIKSPSKMTIPNSLRINKMEDYSNVTEISSLNTPPLNKNYSALISSKISSSTPIHVRKSNRPFVKNFHNSKQFSTILEETPNKMIQLSEPISSIKKHPQFNEELVDLPEGSKLEVPETASETFVTAGSSSPVLTATSKIRHRKISYAMQSADAKVSSAKQLFKPGASSTSKTCQELSGSTVPSVDGIVQLDDEECVAVEGTDAGAVRDKRKGTVERVPISTRNPSIYTVDQFQQKIKRKLSVFAAPPSRSDENIAEKSDFNEKVPYGSNSEFRADDKKIKKVSIIQEVNINTSDARNILYQSVNDTLPNISEDRAMRDEGTAEVAHVSRPDHLLPNIDDYDVPPETADMSPLYIGFSQNVAPESKSLTTNMATVRSKQANAVSTNTLSEVVACILTKTLEIATVKTPFTSPVKSSQPVVNFDLSIDDLFADDDNGMYDQDVSDPNVKHQDRVEEERRNIDMFQNTSPIIATNAPKYSLDRRKQGNISGFACTKNEASKASNQNILSTSSPDLKKVTQSNLGDSSVVFSVASPETCSGYQTPVLMARSRLSSSVVGSPPSSLLSVTQALKLVNVASPNGSSKKNVTARGTMIEKQQKKESGIEDEIELLVNEGESKLEIKKGNMQNKNDKKASQLKWSSDFTLFDFEEDLKEQDTAVSDEDSLHEEALPDILSLNNNSSKSLLPAPDDLNKVNLSLDLFDDNFDGSSVFEHESCLNNVIEQPFFYLKKLKSVAKKKVVGLQNNDDILPSWDPTTVTLSPSKPSLLEEVNAKATCSVSFAEPVLVLPVVGNKTDQAGISASKMSKMKNSEEVSNDNSDLTSIKTLATHISNHDMQPNLFNEKCQQISKPCNEINFIKAASPIIPNSNDLNIVAKKILNLHSSSAVNLQLHKTSVQHNLEAYTKPGSGPVKQDQVSISSTANILTTTSRVQEHSMADTSSICSTITKLHSNMGSEGNSLDKKTPENKLIIPSPVLSGKISQSCASAAFARREKRKLSLLKRFQSLDNNSAHTATSMDGTIKESCLKEELNGCNAVPEIAENTTDKAIKVSSEVTLNKDTKSCSQSEKSSSKLKVVNFDLSFDDIFDVHDPSVDEVGLHNNTSKNKSSSFQATQVSPLNIKRINVNARPNVIDSDDSDLNVSVNKHCTRDASDRSDTIRDDINDQSITVNTCVPPQHRSSSNNKTTVISTSALRKVDLSYGLDTSLGSSDDDFVLPDAVGTTVSVSAAGRGGTGQGRSGGGKGRSRSAAAAATVYICAEAEVSRDSNVTVSSDKDDECQITDVYDQSFVDDKLHPTQASGVDMQGVYLRSVRSPKHGVVSRLPTAGARFTRADVCSQVEDYEHDDEYGESDDSFVVTNDCVEYETQYLEGVEGEDSIMMQVNKKFSPATNQKKRKRIVLADTSSEESTDSSTPDETSSKRRVVCFSSSDEEDSNTPMKQGLLGSHYSASSAAASTSTANTMPHNAVSKSLERKVEFKTQHNVLHVTPNSRSKGALAQLVDGKFKSSEVPVSKTHSSLWLPQHSDGALPDIANQTTPQSALTNANDSLLMQAQNSTRINSFFQSTTVNLLPSCARATSTSGASKLCLRKMSLEAAGISNNIVVSNTASKLREGVLAATSTTTKTIESLSLSSPPRDNATFSTFPVITPTLSTTIQKTSLAAFATPANTVSTTLAIGTTTLPPPTNLATLSAATHTSRTPSAVPLLILAGSAEVSSGGGLLCTALRQTHGAAVHVVTALRHGADYVLSARMAAARIPFATWSSSAHKTRVVARVQALTVAYERPVVLVEHVSNFRGSGPPPPDPPRSRYLDTIVSAAVQLPQLRLLQSRSHAESASLLHRLALRERSRGYDLPVPLSAVPSLQQRMEFYLSLPGVQHGTALCLAYRYDTVARLLTSTPSELQQRGMLSSAAATALHRHLHLTYREDTLMKKT